MKQVKKGLCLALSVAMLCQLTACRPDYQTVAPQPLGDYARFSTSMVASDYDTYVNWNRFDDGSKRFVSSSITPVICYDNLSLGYLTEEATTYKLELVEGSNINGITLSAVDSNYQSIPVEALGSWDESSYTLTANQEATTDGLIFIDCKEGDTVRMTVTVNVLAAYPSDPDYDYDGTDMTEGTYGRNWSNAKDGTTGVHDPALMEAEIDGVHYYYMVQTGWEGGNILRRSTDLKHWENLGKTTPSNMDETDWSTAEAWQLTQASKCSYWAADIVPATGGGYWLYTCVINSGVDSAKHDRVSTVLAWSKDLSAGSFEYKGVICQSISDNATEALYYNIVALDPQVVYDNNKMYLSYGSFGAGIYMIELDPETGLRKDGITEWKDEATIKAYMEEARKCEIGQSHEYYGQHLAYCSEGSVIAHRYDIPIVDESGKVTEIKADYYYLMTCLGSLTRNYVLFTAKSDQITSFSNLSGDAMASGWIGKELVTGQFPPMSGYRKDLDRESYKTTADRIDGSLEYIAMSSFKWADSDFDIHAPGHGDLYTTTTGINIAMLMTRTTLFSKTKVDQCDNGFEIGAKSDKYMMQAHQYYTNAVGDIVINANRYSGEADRAMTKEEFLSFAKDNQFQMVLAGDPYKTTEGIYVTLNEDGSISGDASGSWTVYGKNYIKLEVTGYDTYLGCIAASWLDNKDCVGSTVTAMGQTTGSPLYMNSETNK